MSNNHTSVVLEHCHPYFLLYVIRGSNSLGRTYGYAVFLYEGKDEKDFYFFYKGVGEFPKKKITRRDYKKIIDYLKEKGETFIYNKTFWEQWEEIKNDKIRSNPNNFARSQRFC